MYYLCFPNDRPRQKFLVGSFFIVCTFETALQMRDMVKEFAQSFGDLDVFTTVSLSALLQPVTTGIVSCGIQLFYAHQVFVASGSKFLRGVISFLSVVQLLAAIAQTARAFHFKNYTTLRRKTFVQFTAWLIGSALCDVVIALVMMFYLLRANSGFKHTHAPLRRLSCLFVETGVLPATFATTGCILFLTAPDYTAHHIFIQSLANLYLNTLLVILNSRMSIIHGRAEMRLDNQSISQFYSGGFRCSNFKW
ncbi:hypothetical protein K435DRAFT_689126 [Dendrothele bispora CBS 962.96]|uniref:DUF6534 domain-containing protein n=1 Tax=Dendrothele bispora (strain CBS 962.96) TaxID=1314807 RepID=A0A4S8L501_DENBC|nr:hypothetical protein K435DRAFT_689126 [Dendrothele bispora CBS 962.96]